MMDYELKLERPADTRAYISLITMGAAYFIGKPLLFLPLLSPLHLSNVSLQARYATPRHPPTQTNGDHTDPHPFVLQQAA